jgi:hypothetical protein
MNRTQQRAFEDHIETLRGSFQKARASAGTSGQSRDWFVPYLADVLQVYRSARNQLIGGRSLRKAIAKSRRAVFHRLLETAARDSKTKSRWAAALSQAVYEKVKPAQLATWLTKGGGVAGRAAQYARPPVALKAPIRPKRPTTSSPPTASTPFRSAGPGSGPTPRLFRANQPHSPSDRSRLSWPD